MTIKQVITLADGTVRVKHIEVSKKTARKFNGRVENFDNGWAMGEKKFTVKANNRVRRERHIMAELELLDMQEED